MPAAIASRLLDMRTFYASAQCKRILASLTSPVLAPLPQVPELLLDVLWIDPLLTAIDQANSQLAGIRDIEKNRQGKDDGQ